MISIKCENCRKQYRVPDEAVGKTAKCGRCGAIMKISAPMVTIDDWDEALKSRFTLTKAGCALRQTRYRAAWSGTGGRWEKKIHLIHPWRILWAVQGGLMSSFWISVYNKTESHPLVTPARESDIERLKEGVRDINDTGDILLEVEAGGRDDIHWLIVLVDRKPG